MTAVITPIPHIETMNEGQPPPLSAHVCMGGVVAVVQGGGATHMTQTQIKTENKEQEEKKEHRNSWLVLF